jgi:hypothetical protein
VKLIAHLLLAVTLLSAAACGKKEDAAPTATAPGASYTIDGRSVNTSDVHASFQTGSGGLEDLLTIISINKGSGTNGTEYVQLIFAKPAGGPDSGYHPLRLSFEDDNTAAFYSDNLKMTVTKSGNGYSGTFSGSAPAGSGGKVSQISNGVFTNIP